jgi:hypothetical protein
VGGFHRLGGACRSLALAAAALAALGLGTGPSRAQAPPSPIRVVIFGDSQAQGIAGGLQRVLVDDDRYRVLNRSHPGAALVHPSREWLAPVENFVAGETADIAVVMFGANDRLDMREEPDGPYLHFRSAAWREAYTKRADLILTALGKAHLRVVWCGNPIARSPTYSADMEYINRIYQDETARFGATFFPLWRIIVDGEGHYVAYGKDRDGVTERLRGDDGIHFTGAGYQVIAEKLVALFPSIMAKPPSHLPSAAPAAASPPASAKPAAPAAPAAPPAH